MVAFKLEFPTEDDMIVGNDVLERPCELAQFLIVWGFDFTYYVENKIPVFTINDKERFYSTTNEWPEGMLNGVTKREMQEIILVP